MLKATIAETFLINFNWWKGVWSCGCSISGSIQDHIEQGPEQPGEQEGAPSMEGKQNLDNLKGPF